MTTRSIRLRATDPLTLAALGFLVAGVPAWLLVDRAPPSAGQVARVAGRTIEPAPAPAVPPRRMVFGGATPPLYATPNDDALADTPDLVGIVGRLPDDAVALVRAPDGRSQTIAIGEAAGGWRLAALGVDAALFVKGAERRRVALPAATTSN